MHTYKCIIEKGNVKNFQTNKSLSEVIEMCKRAKATLLFYM